MTDPRIPIPAGMARRGSILIVTILVVFAMAGMVLTLSRSMATEAAASGNRAAAARVAAVERAGEQYVLSKLASAVSSGVSPLSLDQTDFEAVAVGDSGWFWILRPIEDDPSLPVFGLVDENAKLDLNTAPYPALMRLAVMTDDLASSIIDWRDENDTPTGGGAESQYYLSLPDGYSAKNAPFETVEELLLVRGVTPALLYGDGSAGVLGRSTLAGVHPGNVLGDWELARGLFDRVTVYSGEPAAPTGDNAPVNLNAMDQRFRLREVLEQRLGASRGEAIMSALGRERVVDVFDFAVRVNLTREEFDKVADAVTIGGARRRGRINVNTAPRAVLLTLASLDEADVDKLLSARASADSSNPAALGWVLEALGPKATGLGQRLTGVSSRYSADVLAVSADGRAFKRCRIVMDSAAQPARILYRRDLSNRGWPMDTAILESIRTGAGPWGGSTPLGGIVR